MTTSTLLAKTPAFDSSGEASLRLWELINKGLQGSRPADPANTNLPDSQPVSMLGRCLVPDGIYFVCEATAVSASGLTITCSAPAYLDDHISVHLRGLGAIEGVVVSKNDLRFVLDLRETPDRIVELSKRLIWSIRRQTEGAPERRMSERIDQKRRRTMLRTRDGRVIPGEMLDLSISGAAVHLGASALKVWVSQQVTLDDRSGQVLRHFPGGVVIEFDEARAVNSADDD